MLLYFQSKKEISDDDCTFLVRQPDNDFFKFQAVSSNMFLTADKRGKVFLATETFSNEREAWFQVISASEDENVAFKETEFLLSSISDNHSSELTAIIATNEE